MEADPKFQETVDEILDYMDSAAIAIEAIKGASQFYALYRTKDGWRRQYHGQRAELVAALAVGHHEMAGDTLNEWATPIGDDEDEDDDTDDISA